MKHKAKECVWAPGTQNTDITYAGDHTWSEIARARKLVDRDRGPGAPKGLFIILGLGIVSMALCVWFFD